jgi:hypothetical protein
MSAIKISDSFTQLELRLKDISDLTTATRLQMAQEVSDFVARELYKTDPERFVLTQTYTTTSGTASLTLPTDFQHIQSFGNGLYEVDSNGVDTANRKVVTSFGSQYPGFYIQGNSIILTPTPTKSETLKFRYMPKSPTYTSINEYFTISKAVGGVEIIPSEFQQYLIDALVVKYNIWDESPDAESFSDVRYTRSLDELVRNIKRTPDCYALPDQSLMY